MFLAYNKSIPLVEDCILDRLGPRDLVNTKRVCMDWAKSVRRYIGQIGTKRTSDLMEQALLKPVSTYATVKLPYPVRDLTVNDRGELYILGDESITQLDHVNFRVKRRIENCFSNDSHTKGFFLYANTDGSEFVIRKIQDFCLVSTGVQYDESKSDRLLTRNITKDLLLMRRNEEVFGLPIPHTSKGETECRGSDLEILNNRCLCRFHKMKKRLGASDLVRLPNGSCIFAKEIKSCDSHAETLLVHKRRSEYVPIARLPLRGVRLRIVGTRVLCFSKILEIGAESDCIIAFDIWNPESLEYCGDNVEITRKVH